MTPLLHGETDTEPAGGGSCVQTLPAQGREKEGVLARGLPSIDHPCHWTQPKWIPGETDRGD